MPGFPKPYADFVAKLRVPCGFVLVAAFAWLASPTWSSLAVGLPVSVLGLLLRAWAAGHVEKNVRLASSGPYAYLRNPLYVGTLLVAAGLALASRRWILAGLTGLVFLFVYLPVVELEEQHLRSLFADFSDYTRRVPAFWPTRKPRVAAHRFRWNLYMRNREYQALLGFLAGAALLAAKALLAVRR